MRSGTEALPSAGSARTPTRALGPASDLAVAAITMRPLGRPFRLCVTAASDPTTGQNTLGLYSGNNIVVQSGSLTIAGQLFANNDIQTAASTQITGSVTARNNLQTHGTFGVTYRPANASLTRPYWPGEVGTSSAVVRRVVRRVVRVSSREWLAFPA